MLPEPGRHGVLDFGPYLSEAFRQVLRARAVEAQVATYRDHLAAAGVEPHVDMNPLLLKPTAGGAQMLNHPVGIGQAGAVLRQSIENQTLVWRELEAMVDEGKITDAKSSVGILLAARRFDDLGV